MPIEIRTPFYPPAPMFPVRWVLQQFSGLTDEEIEEVFRLKDQEETS